MTTDWRRILARHGIAFRDERRNLYVHCFLCGSADQGQHLGISTEGRGWGCFRNVRHRGKSDVKLLAGLLKLDYARASALLGKPYSGLDASEDLAAHVQRLLAPAPAEAVREAISLPPEIKPLVGKRTRERTIFLDYLEDRGYAYSDLDRLCARYQLYYAMTGPFAYRVIVPIHDADNGLVTWTGRSVSLHATPRYLTLSVHQDSKLVEQGQPLARAAITDMLLQEPRLFNRPCKTLVVCEGPFDALRVDFACHDRDVLATCLFGKTISTTQYDKLCSIEHYSDHKFLLLDPDARLDTFALSDRLFSLGFKPIHLPEQYEDAGDKTLAFVTLRKLIDTAIRNP